MIIFDPSGIYFWIRRNLSQFYFYLPQLLASCQTSRIHTPFYYWFKVVHFLILFPYIFESVSGLYFIQLTCLFLSHYYWIFVSVALYYFFFNRVSIPSIFFFFRRSVFSIFTWWTKKSFGWLRKSPAGIFQYSCILFLDQLRGNWHFYNTGLYFLKISLWIQAFSSCFQ